MPEPIEYHDRGLAFDPETIGAQLIERRRALAFLFGSVDAGYVATDTIGIAI